MDKYWISVRCSWAERVEANSVEEAIEKMEKLYKYGKGRFPRKYVVVEEENWDFVQVEE